MEKRPVYPGKFVPPATDPSLKIDEGYSEDADSPTRTDVLSEGAVSQSWSVAAGVPPQIMALDEVERSGMASAPSSLMPCDFLLTDVNGRFCL